ncbi:MAG TPA: hemerythrin domain-containing protein [Micropepsaceae bacterium]|nr:hemerythrin domain-containing protein [Micropepsaceae bacterium]
MVSAIATCRMMFPDSKIDTPTEQNERTAAKHAAPESVRGFARRNKGVRFMPMQTSTSHGGTARRTKTRASARGKTKQQNAIQLLSSDHDEVEKLFKQFKKSNGRKAEIVRRICMALTVHAEIEEEIFYPAMRDAMAAKDESMMDEATVEHETIRNLVEEIEGSGTDDEMLSARMKVLCEYVTHHVKEEEEKIFPKAKKARLDLDELGVELLERKMELMGEQA